jgi:outer membrane protein insertion porin family
MRRLPALALALLCGASLPSLAQQPDVKRIEIEGLRIHSQEEIRQKMETRVGRPYSPETLERDVRRLFATGWFADVRKSDRSVERGPDAAVIILEVLENDVLAEVKFVGNRRLKDEELEQGAHLKKDEYFAPYKVKLDANRIRDLYLEEGHAFVRVDSSETATGTGTIVTFTVREGPRVIVSDIFFHGNEELSSGRLARAMETKDRSLWSIFSSPVYKAAQLEEDVRLMLRYARSEGWLDAKIYVRELAWNEDKTDVDIHFQVEEGIRYFVDSVEVEGNAVIETKELMKGLRLKPGDPYGLRYVERDETWLLDKYGERAYIDAEVVGTPQFLAEAGKVKLVWKIREGQKVRVGRIDFFGNKRTQEKVLRREIRLLPGEDFDKRKLDTGIDRIRALGFFEPHPVPMINRAWPAARDPIVVVEVIPGAEPDMRDVMVHVVEGRTGHFEIGGSYSDEGGFQGRLSVTQSNFDIADLPKSFAELFTGEGFAGAGQTARIHLEPGFERSRYELSFTEPWFFGYPVSMTVAGVSYDQDFRFYRERRLTGSIDFGRRWDEFLYNTPGALPDETTEGFWGGVLQGLSYFAIHIPGWFVVDEFAVQGYPLERFWERNWGVGVGYRWARIDIRDVDDDAPAAVFDVDGLNYLSVASARVSLTRVNSRVFPSQGFISTVSYDHAGHPLGGDFDFWRWNYRHQAYTTLWTRKDGGKTIFATEVTGGWAQEHYHTDEVPIFERYFAGGRSLRGFEFRTISPKENGEPVGGEIMVLASAELTFPIIRPEIMGRDVDVLRGRFFTDWGTVSRSTHDFGYFRWSVGFGVSLQIPLGPQVVPVTIDFGFPIREQEDDDTKTVHFGFDFGF